MLENQLMYEATGLTQNHYIWCEKLSFSRYCHYN